VIIKSYTRRTNPLIEYHLSVILLELNFPVVIRLILRFFNKNCQLAN